MNEHRESETRAGIPYRIEFRVVDLETAAVDLLVRQSQALRDFTDTDRTRSDIGFELRNRFHGPAWASHSVETDAGQRTHAIFHRGRCAHGVHHAF